MRSGHWKHVLQLPLWVVLWVALPRGLGDFQAESPIAIAHATPQNVVGIDTAAAYPIHVDVAPILGERSSGSPGWLMYLVRLRNLTGAPLAGTLYLTRSTSQYGEPNIEEPLVQTAFHVGGTETVVLRVPVAGEAARSIDAIAVGSDNSRLGLGRAECSSFDRPFLFSLDNPSPLVALLRDQTVPGLIAPGSGPPLTAASELAYLDAKTGDPLLPDHAAGYSPATVVFTSSEQLVNLKVPELTALASWVLAGGTLAVTLTRPEDLRHDTLTRLLGGVAERAEPQGAHLDELLALYSAATSPWDGAIEHSASDSSRKPAAGALPAEMLRKIRGFRGGNLRDSDFGGSATYGLGEVHLLSFNPSELTDKIPSTWTRQKLLDLLAHAAYRTRHVALPHGRLPFDQGRAYWVRKAVDPNPGNHGFLIAAALLLVVYALLAGPLNFQLAAGRGKPLQALYRLPLWSLGALGLVLVLGSLSRGGAATARHLTLIEAGAGMPRGSALRFRAFYADALSDRAITVSERGAVVALNDDGDDTRATLVATSEGLTLEHLHTKPWQTTLFREEGFADLGRGVSLVEERGQLVIKNRLGRDLLGVVVRDLSGALYSFEQLADGTTTQARTGQPIQASTTLAASGVYPLDLTSFEHTLERVSPGLADAWRAVETLRSDDIDWWPGDVPVLIGQIRGGEGRLEDSGIPLTQDRVLLRVVGFGGTL
ncbi:MAG: hypothetical protein RJA70_1192 [Pseudomonadota bacterium]|jgi:hypothetical protein